MKSLIEGLSGIHKNYTLLYGSTKCLLTRMKQQQKSTQLSEIISVLIAAQSEFDSITEEVVSDMLRNLTSETFEKVYEPVTRLYQNQHV